MPAGLSADQRAVITQRQLSTVAYLFPRAAALLVPGTGALIGLYVSPSVGYRRWTWLVGVAVVVSLSACCWTLRGRRGAFSSRVDGGQCIVTMSVTAALFWGFYGDLKGSLTAAGTADVPFSMMAFTAAGAALVSVYFPAAVAFLATTAVGMMVTVVEWHSPAAVLLQSTMIIIWLSSMLMAARYLSVAVGRWHLAELTAESERENVALLLHDFESGSPDWLWETSESGLLTRISPRFETVSGRSAVELEAQSLPELLGQLDAADGLGGRSEVMRCIQHGQPFRDLLVSVSVAGELRWWQLSGKPRAAGAGWRGTGSDVTELKTQQDSIRFFATTDQLTALHNRHAFEGLLRLSLDAGSDLCLAVLDLDGFKTVNDALGHPAGDRLLAAAGRRIAERAGLDAVGRIGGDEFAVLLQGVGDQAAQTICQALLDSIRDPFIVGGARMDITASIGLARYPRDGKMAEELMRAADLALYAAKAAGRDRVMSYFPGLGAAADQRALAVHQLSRAIATNQLEVFYQPQVDSSGGHLVGFEALLRWRHPDRGLIGPDQFIAVAEETGLIVDIGAWVLRRACDQASNWPAHVRVAVNLSMAQLRSSRIVQTVVDALAEAALPARRLELEVTESLLIDEQAVRAVTELSGLGITIAVDDFGVGYSSLASLSQIPVDRLKIDRHFTAALQSGAQRSTELVRAIITVARSLQLETVAEGVETVAAAAALHQLGADILQGFLYGRPRPAEAWRDLVGAMPGAAPFQT